MRGVVISVYGIDLEFIGVCFNYPLFFESVDVVEGCLCGKGAVIWIESVRDDLSDPVVICNVVCVGCWCRREDVAGVKIE